MMYLLVVSLMLITIGIPTGMYSEIWVLLDIPSFLIVLLIPITLIIVSGLWNDLLRGFKIILSKENIYNKMELKKSEVAIKACQSYIWLCGIFGSILGIVTLLGLIEDMENLLSSVSVSLLTLFYSLIIVILLEPLKYKIKGILIDIDGEKDDI